MPYQLGGPTVEGKTLTIPATTSDYRQEIFIGKLPERVVVMMVEASHFSCTYVTNPLSFQHFNVQQIIMRYNGKQIRMAPYAPTWTAGDYKREYLMLHHNLGYDKGDRAFSLTPQEWAGLTRSLFGS